MFISYPARVSESSLFRTLARHIEGPPLSARTLFRISNHQSPRFCALPPRGISGSHSFCSFEYSGFESLSDFVLSTSSFELLSLRSLRSTNHLSRHCQMLWMRFFRSNRGAALRAVLIFSSHLGVHGTAQPPKPVLRACEEIAVRLNRSAPQRSSVQSKDGWPAAAIRLRNRAPISPWAGT